MPITIGETLKRFNTVLETTQDSQLKLQLTGIQAEMTQHAQAFETERNTLLSQNSAAQSQIAALSAQVSGAQADSARNTALVADLQKQLATVASATSAKPIDIANSFKSVVDEIQSQARVAPGIGTTISSMQIEVRGVVQVAADGTSPVLVFPGAHASVDPGAFSTMRVSFAAVPVPGAAPAPAPR